MTDPRRDFQQNMRIRKIGSCEVDPASGIRLWCVGAHVAVRAPVAQAMVRPLALDGRTAAETRPRKREVRPLGGPTEMVRDAQILPEDWERIVTSDKVGIALNGGTIRLEGSPPYWRCATLPLTAMSNVIRPIP